jgi:predicted nucleic acid-binding protein
MALLTARYLADKSALARMRDPSVMKRLGPLIEAGEVATCALVDLEVLFSVRSHEEHVRTRTRRGLAYEHVPLTDATFERAMDVQSELARTGQHRIPIPDLVIAAAAESAGLTVLHYDSDFETIAECTEQSTEWVVPRGSVS